MSMTDEQFVAMTKALAASARAFPKCRIANCACDEYGGEWKKGCACMGHFRDMDAAYGEGKWTLPDFMDAAHQRIRRTRA